MKTNKKSTIDTDKHQFNKAIQCQSWDGVANGYRKWHKQIEEKGARKVSNRLLELAEIRPGHRVLDIATGYGEPAVSAAQCVSSSHGYVLAIDTSRQMLEIAKERSTELGLQNIIEFKQSDAERVELPKSFFDIAVCRWGLMFLPNLNAVLSRIYDVLIQGGRFASAVWSSPHKVPLISLPMNVIRREIGSQMSQTDPSTLGPFSLSDINILEQSFIQAGFQEIRTELIDVIFELPSAEQFIEIIQELNVSFNSVLSNMSTVKKAKILKAITDELDHSYIDNQTGHIRLANETICISGRKGGELN